MWSGHGWFLTAALDGVDVELHLCGRPWRTPQAEPETGHAGEQPRPLSRKDLSESPEMGPELHAGVGQW